MAAYRKTLSWSVWALLVVFWDGGALAADWTIGGGVQERIEFDDNVRLVTENKEQAFGSTTTLDLNVEARTPVSTLNATVGLGQTVFFGAEDLDSFDQHLAAGGEHRTQRVTLSANAGFDRETTRTSEIIDTGRTDVDEDRTSLTLGASVAYRASMLDSITLSSNFSDVSFDGGSGELTDFRTGGLTDYRTYGGSVSWSRPLTARIDMNASLTASRFETQSGRQEDQEESNWYSVDIGLTRALLENLEWRGSIGVTHVSTDFQELVGGSLVSRQRTSTGFSTDSGVSYTLERTTIRANVASGFSPSARGEVVERGSVGARVDHRLTPRITLFVDGSFQTDISQRDTSTTSDTTGDRTFWSVEPGVRWAFLPNWTASASYRYRSDDVDDTGDRAVSNAVFATVAYQMKALKVR